jgi:hypothetical protein
MNGFIMLYARRVLADCRRAHELLEIETQEDRFRLLWVAGIALARAVGHVLDKVDGEQDNSLARIIRAKYASWKQHRSANSIFWNFIEDERNRVLKEYSVGFLSGPMNIVADNKIYTLDENLFCPLSDGAFAGEDCRDVLKSAIEWWERQLDDIEIQFRGS